MSNTVTLITPPNQFWGNQHVLLLVGVGTYVNAVCNILSNHTADVTVYALDDSVDLPWLMSSFDQCDFCILNCEFSKFITGLLIDKPRTYYYNSTCELSVLNVNCIQDPVEFAIQYFDTVSSDCYNK